MWCDGDLIGSIEQDLDGDEDDGYDEVIYPIDFKTAGHIVDDDIHDILVKPLPPGCRLTAIFDSCHSATAMDLPYIYSTEGKIKEPKYVRPLRPGPIFVTTRSIACWPMLVKVPCRPLVHIYVAI